MSWKLAYGYMQHYRDIRADALNNSSQRRMHWFTDDVKSYKQLITEHFGSTEENATWQQLRLTKGDTTKMQAEELKVAFLCGSARDLSSCFACDGLRGMTSIDADRKEYMRLTYHGAKLELLRKAIEIKEKGVT